MGPPKEVTPSFRKAAKTSPGVPCLWLRTSVSMVRVDDFTKELPACNGYSSTHIGLKTVSVSDTIMTGI